MFCKKCVFKSFAKFTGKHLCQSLFFNKVAGLTPATLLKKKTLAQVFSCEFCELFKNTFFYRTPPVTGSLSINMEIKSRRNAVHSTIHMSVKRSSNIYTFNAAQKANTSLKVVSATFLEVCFLSLKESTCETMKNMFHFTSKVLFIFEKIKL